MFHKNIQCFETFEEFNIYFSQEQINYSNSILLLINLEF